MNDNKLPGVLDRIAKKNSFKIKKSVALADGDINQVFLITGPSAEKLVVKLNSAHKFPGMFRAERSGLIVLKKSGSIDVPEAYSYGEIEDISYLLLEYKETGSPVKDYWESFGSRLADLHKNTAGQFGFQEDNYIGSLPQYNKHCCTADEFFITQRLQPQFRLASEKNYELKISDRFYQNVSNMIPNEAPSLIHGDLWSGNYLVNSAGLPCLIDPAVAYAPREMDLGMMKLFGGFRETLFRTYEEIFPTEPGFQERLPLWQLYYLLVHLNIFGKAYHKRVTDILTKFS